MHAQENQFNNNITKALRLERFEIGRFDQDALSELHSGKQKSGPGGHDDLVDWLVVLVGWLCWLIGRNLPTQLPHKPHKPDIW